MWALGEAADNGEPRRTPTCHRKSLCRSVCATHQGLKGALDIAALYLSVEVVPAHGSARKAAANRSLGCTPPRAFPGFLEAIPSYGRSLVKPRHSIRPSVSLRICRLQQAHQADCRPTAGRLQHDRMDGRKACRLSATHLDRGTTGLIWQRYRAVALPSTIGRLSR